MTKPRTILLAAVVGASALVSGGALLSALDDDEAAAASHLVNQVWIDRLPEHERDMIVHLLVLEHPQARIGVVGHSSQWRHFLELFRWGLEGDRLVTVFPQERTKARFRVRTWTCEGEAPAPFELCLKVSRGDRSAVFYSREDWVIEPHDAAASLADLVEREPALAGLDLPALSAGEASPDEEDPDELPEAGPELSWLPGPP